MRRRPPLLHRPASDNHIRLGWWLPRDVCMHDTTYPMYVALKRQEAKSELVSQISKTTSVQLFFT